MKSIDKVVFFHIIWYSGSTNVPKRINMEKISRTSLSELVAGKLADLILEGTYKPGYQLPSERDLVKQFGISRTTLREALKALEEINVIEARHGAGWFASELNEGNLSKAHQMAAAARVSTPDMREEMEVENELAGPRRLPVSPEKPLVIPNLKTDRMGTFQLISWWEREKVQNAKVMVVGAGALGNEVIKNLVLMGVGYIYIVDFDVIELANLSRSILFRESDSGRKKAEVAAARAKELNPYVHVQYLHGDVTTDIGLGVFRRMDVIIGCLDNREARLAVNRFAYWVNKPWVDGAIQEFLGLARVFLPGQGACFECTLTEQARRDLSIRYSCPLLARENILLGKVPTTPTIASIIGAIQAQEALKLIHGLPVDAGKVLHFNGMTNEVHTTSYTPDEECESHWNYGEITELPFRVNSSTFNDILQVARRDLGQDAVIELDQELVIALSCPNCKTREEILEPISQVGFNRAHCPSCGLLRETEMTHSITGKENFLNKNLSMMGVPALHILRAFNSKEFRFYEISGDLAEAMHFSHFDIPNLGRMVSLKGRIKLGEKEAPKVKPRIILHEKSTRIDAE